MHYAMQFSEIKTFYTTIVTKKVLLLITKTNYNGLFPLVEKHFLDIF